MSRTFMVLAAAIAGFAGTEGWTQVPATPGPHYPTIVVLGSSTAAGAGVKQVDSAWVWRFTTDVKGVDPMAVVINLAVGGYGTYDLMADGFLPPAGRTTPKTKHNVTRALAHHPDLVVINLPSNDAASGVPPGEEMKNFRDIVGQLRGGGADVYVTTTQPRNLEQAERRGWQMAVRDSIRGWMGNRAVDFWTGLANGDGTLSKAFDSGDGIHLNETGHRILAERIRASGILERISDIRKAAGR
jgi:lysophospholipase L1-like esterase